MRSIKESVKRNRDFLFLDLDNFWPAYDFFRTVQVYAAKVPEGMIEELEEE